MSVAYRSLFDIQGDTSQSEICLSRPSITEIEHQHVTRCLKSGRLAGGGEYTERCEAILTNLLNTHRVLLTSSCTHALEMAMLLIGISPGDEVILPSFTFSSTANAVALFGGTPIFVDINPDTMNIDPDQIQPAITKRTRAILVVHYAGVACDMQRICAIAKDHNLRVIEDAAHAVLASYMGKPLGTIGDIGCFSFHDSKNLVSGEGGAIIINDPSLIRSAEVIREKGTDRSAFFRGEIDKYTWLRLGSSYLMGELSAALLLGQLERAEEITSMRRSLWEQYQRELTPLSVMGAIELPRVPPNCNHNAHIFFIKTRDPKQRASLIEHLRRNGIFATFHYLPLHSSPAGRHYGEMRSIDRFSTRESERLIRLPLYCDLKENDVSRITAAINLYFANL